MNYYNEISQGYEELHKEEQLKKLKIIKKNFDFGNSVLDVGCGTGFCLDEIKAKTTGIDPSENLIKIGKRKGRNVLVASAESIPFQDNEFDSVISLTAAHHFKSNAFEEMKRVGKEDFAFSILKKSQKLEEIKRTIAKLFKIVNVIEEDKDVIFICKTT